MGDFWDKNVRSLVLASLGKNKENKSSGLTYDFTSLLRCVTVYPMVVDHHLKLVLNRRKAISNLMSNPHYLA